LQAVGTLKIGSNYQPGVYFAEIIQGDTRRIIKLIKMNN
jgi:hypothetical protein